jgi:SAM-dependent methyltransferase
MMQPDPRAARSGTAVLDQREDGPSRATAFSAVGSWCAGRLEFLISASARTGVAGDAGTFDHPARDRRACGWEAADPAWGIWGIWGVAEAQAGVLPPDLEDRDSIELGCGTGYVSAWLARRGTRPVGLDNSAAQLATAPQLQDRFGLWFPLVHASAEHAPFADAHF